MNAVLHTRPALPLAIAALALAVSAVPVVAQEIPFEEARLFFELNDTDGDLGIHSSIDGEPWKFLAIDDPTERRILSTTPTGRLRLQGLTQFFFESSEFGFDELTPAEFFARFPEGVYEIEGLTLEGDEMESRVRLSHLLPGPPQNLRVNGLAVGENCDDTANIPTVSPPVIITWNAVTQSHPTLGRRGPAKVARYQVFAEQRTEDPLIFSLDLPPTMTRYSVAPELLALGDRQIKFEIQVREVNGNQTAVENCFNVAR
jgi:hypothetical protein